MNLFPVLLATGCIDLDPEEERREEEQQQEEIENEFTDLEDYFQAAFNKTHRP